MADIPRILATIRQLESGGNYTARNPTSSASGAYQFIDSSWRAAALLVGVTGYPRAYQAPPAIQDKVAAGWVQRILLQNGGSLRAVPLVWYTGRNREGNTVPAGGNRLTPTQYADKWMAIYNKTAGGSGDSSAITGTPVSFASDALKPLKAFADLIKFLTSPGTWVRAVAFSFGALFLLFGINSLTGAGAKAIGRAKTLANIGLSAYTKGAVKI